jgi:hypothetical protein
MAIKRYYSNADNTITNAFQSDLTTRGTGSNMGQADILEVFSIYGQSGGSSTDAELSRIIINFPAATMASDRSSGLIPASGNVSFFLKMFNAEHRQTTPRSYTLAVHALEGSWEEGFGLDMEGYEDLTYDKVGSNWIRRTGTTAWDTAGGQYFLDSSSSFEQEFDSGLEDMEIDITVLVEQWINSDGNVLGSKDRDGVIVKLESTLEAQSDSNLTGSVSTFYTKKFFSRSSEYFFKRPVVEARWDSATRDNRGNFYISSSLSTPTDNLNTLYMYNYVRGNLRDIGNRSTNLPALTLYHASASVPEIGSRKGFLNSENVAVEHLTSSRESVGVYKATFAVTSSVVSDLYPYLVDVWTLDGTQVHTGSAFLPKTHALSGYNPNSNYVISVSNLKQQYNKRQIERFRLFVRERGWSPNIYTKASATPETLLIESASYQLTRLADDLVVINYGTSSTNHTMLSYDVSGNYFDLDMKMLEPGYTYGLKFSFYEDAVGSYVEQPNTFKFRVIEDEY